MYRFEKLSVKNINTCNTNKPQEFISWGLIISDLKQLGEYHSYDVKASYNAFMTLERSTNKDAAFAYSTAHLSLRATGIAQYLNCRIMTNSMKGIRTVPLIELSKMSGDKYFAMQKCIIQGQAVRILEHGSYCDYDSFKRAWDTTVLETVDKPDFGFPVGKEVLTAQTICLENGGQGIGDNSHLSYASKLGFNSGTIATIFNLREQDMSYVFKCLEQAKNIIIPSLFVDEGQINGFMKMFTTLPSKNVYIISNPDRFEAIKNHPLYPINNTIHIISFSCF